MEQYLINGQWCERRPLSSIKKKSTIFYLRRQAQVAHTHFAIPYKISHKTGMNYRYENGKLKFDDAWVIEKVGEKYKYDDTAFAQYSGDKMVYVPIE